MTVVPMFPLGSVLFPHMPLGLRLFEPRYLRMLGQLLEDPSPAFGVVLIERGHEVGGGDQRFGIGTFAQVVEVEAHEGFMAVLAQGTQRFAVRQWLPDDPYPRAEVDPLPDPAWDDDLGQRLGHVEEQVRQALRVAGGPADVELAEDPVARCWQVAALTPVGPLDQMHLLGADTLTELLERTSDITSETLDTLRLGGWTDGSGGLDGQ